MNMKKKVILSTYVRVITAVTLYVLIAVAAYLYVYAKEEALWALMLVTLCLIALCGSALWYAPMSVSADNQEVRIHFSMRAKSIPYSTIASVRLCQPTMGEMRLFGSGGFFGYWGLFRDGDAGKYIAYYGKSSDCFLVTLQNGRKYMLGCADPKEMVAYIQQHLN